MGSSSAIVSTIVQNWREHPPSSYSLKVHNFSQLVNSTTASDDKYQSRLFSSGGYNWYAMLYCYVYPRYLARLIVYPNGNGKDDGSGFISMYVEIDSKITTEVFAELRFFVYNKKENKPATCDYALSFSLPTFVFQLAITFSIFLDLEVRRFNALKTVWGLQQFLPLDTFNDLKNGYIFEGGHCEFGVDVIVASPLTNWEILSFDEKLSNPKFSWAVKKFSDLKEHVYTSDSFSMGGRQWVLKMYPKGASGSDGKWLSFYLFLAAGDTLKADEKVFRQGHIRVLDPLGSNHIELKTNRWVEGPVEGSYTGWGWDQFLSLAELRKSYLDKKDTLNVEVEFELMVVGKQNISCRKRKDAWIHEQLRSANSPFSPGPSPKPRPSPSTITVGSGVD
ncbi:hypothetical protein YC2023_079874 [Brassica napus]